jgi:hypothetical protein
MLTKVFIVMMMLAILTALLRGGFYLVKDQGKTTRTLSSLKWRIGLSLSLFIFLFIAYANGWIQPHGIN